MWNYANAQFRLTRETFRGQICVKKPSTVLYGTDISQEDFYIKFSALQRYHFLVVTMKLPSDFVDSLPLAYVWNNAMLLIFFPGKILVLTHWISQSLYTYQSTSCAEAFDECICLGCLVQETDNQVHESGASWETPLRSFNREYRFYFRVSAQHILAKLMCLVFSVQPIFSLEPRSCMYISYLVNLINLNPLNLRNRNRNNHCSCLKFH